MWFNVAQAAAPAATTDLAPVLERVRKDLLDLSARNPLLSTARGGRRGGVIDVVDERSAEVFDILIRKRCRMGFRARPQASEEAALDGEGPDAFAGLALPEGQDEVLAADGVAARHRDLWLQTPLSPERLQSRLLKLSYDARSLYEERGVHVLYLALGFLAWYEAPAATTPRYAPLILVPVRLERAGALERFRIEYADEELVPNICLAEKLARGFGLSLPPLPDAEDLDPAAYCAAVAQALDGEAGFAVEPDAMALGLFSFTRLLMWRDLDPASWPRGAGLADHPLLEALLGGGFRDPPDGLPDEGCLDELLPAAGILHVLDADSSQATAIEEVRRGRNLLIQGPPGTGKSQTIANLIASAVHAGKRVLFVAEKMAALEVVRRRLEQQDLGPICLELHSRRATRREVVEELRRTLELGRPQPPASELIEELEAARARLNRYAHLLHRPLQPAGLTPHTLIGHLVGLARRGVAHAPAELRVAGWSRADIDRRRGLVAACARRILGMGPPAAHPWRGVGLEAALPGDVARISAEARTLADFADALEQAAWRLAADLRLETVDQVSLADVDCLLETAEYLTLAPSGIDTLALGDAVWLARRDDIERLARAGLIRATVAAELGEVVREQAFDVDVAPLRDALARLGRSWWRGLRPRWWRCRQALRALLRAPAPASLAELLQILDRLIEHRAAGAQIEFRDALGAAAFGRLWQGLGSDFARLHAIETWERDGHAGHLLPDAPRLLGRLTRPERAAELTAAAQQLLATLEHRLEVLFERLDLDLDLAFGQAMPEAISLAPLSARLASWAERGQDLLSWIALRHEMLEAEAADLGPLLEGLADGRIAPERAVDAFDAAVFEPLLRHAMRISPALASFDGESHSELVARFQRLDRARIDLARAEVISAHDRGLPRAQGGGGQLGILEQEFRKRRRHLPIRQLLARAGAAVQAVKPVFMMSPLSVAEFLTPGALHFDLLLIDEASQVEPVDALGAIARCAQLVVVGDDRQLPPTPFFRGRLAGEPDSSPDNAGEDEPVRDLESILGLCAARGMPQRMLRWHYRSRHPALIAVSNREFYDDRLYVVPSPVREAPDLGLAFHHLQDGVYDRGGSRTNRVEAAAVARAAIEHARSRPELSLGIGCFSVQQRDAVLAELELLWRSEPELKDFFRAGALQAEVAEPFFVKNLENIQGDERDVVFISIGYARDRSGYLAMSFGPLNADGGERRLNVLISRARRRLEVFASITADDIDLARSDRRGVQVLKTFLQFAQTGVLGVAERTGRGYDSPFEAEVARALQDQGYRLESQVGLAGFFVDLAVLDPERPGRYLLGIECDGAAYHSARWARDRDRLRQQVLEDQLWIIHRIWSGDWFRHPERELRRVVAAIARAQAVWRARDLQHAAATGRSTPRRPIVRLQIKPDGEALPPVAVPYEEADFPRPGTLEPHLLPPDVLLEALCRIVRVEGPVHGDEVARRLTRICGYARTGRRIADAVAEALERAVAAGRLERTADFYGIPGAEVAVRDRSGVMSPSLRRPEMLPPAEVRAALLSLVRSRFGLHIEEAAVQAGRLLGFQATSAQLRAVVGAALDDLVAAGSMERDEQGLLRERRSAA